MDKRNVRNRLFDNEQADFIEKDNHFGSDQQNKRMSSNNRVGYARVKVIGVGGGGCNVVNTMINFGVCGVVFCVCNTDKQALDHSVCENKLILGYEITKGLGAGANPDIGEQAANESKDEIKNILRDTDMIFIASGMGGGTGTGAAHVIAKIAKELNILTVACVTKPFDFEGPLRRQNANDGINMLRKYVDSMIIVSNERLLEVIGDISFLDAFIESDKILLQAVQAVTDLITIPAQINLDFADIKTIMENKGIAMIGVGEGEGEDRALKAAEDAVSCQLLDMKIRGAKNALVNITGANPTPNEAKQVIETIKKHANADIDVIYGLAINKNLEKQMIVTVIATGFDNQDLNRLDDISSSGMNNDEDEEYYDENFLSENKSKADINWEEDSFTTSKSQLKNKKKTTNQDFLSDKYSTTRLSQNRKKEQQKTKHSRSKLNSNQKSHKQWESYSFTHQIRAQESKIQRSIQPTNVQKNAIGNQSTKVSRCVYKKNARERAQANDDQDTHSEVPSFLLSDHGDL